jgi:hypothetical protein
MTEAAIDVRRASRADDASRATATAPEHARVAGIDNLRVGLSALVVIHHTLLPYAFRANWWVVERVPPVPELGLPVWINACFFMGLFFLIAGLFTPGSIDRKGVGPFVADRVRRLGIPLLLGVFVLLPPISWYAHVHNRQVPWVSFAEYYTHLWLGIGPRPADWPAARWPDLNFGHLWFVENLLIFSLVYAAWRRVRPPRARGAGAPPGDFAIAAFTIALGVVTWLVRLRYPIDAWTALFGFMQSEPAHLPQYASLFVLGLVAGRRGWFDTFPAKRGRRWLRLGIAAILFASVRAAADQSIAVNALDTCLVEALICVGLSIGLLVGFRDRWNRATWVTGFGPDTYAVYVFHYGVVGAVQLVLLPLAAGALAKAAIAVPVAVVASFAVGRAVRRLPGATAVF